MKNPTKRVNHYLNSLEQVAKGMPYIYVRLFVNDRNDARTLQRMYDFSQWATVYSKPCHEWSAQQFDDVHLVEKQANEEIAKEDVQHAPSHC